MKFRLMMLLLGITLLAACDEKYVAEATVKPAPLEIKVVVVTMFEIGADAGDQAGEFQLWKERQHLDSEYEFPQSHHPIFVNKKTGVMGIVTGMGTAKSASAIMALGLDPRFDLTKAYWLVAGIAGFDPADASLGSAAWAEYLVDGDLAHEIDPREMPSEWKTGYFPLFAAEPYPQPMREENLGEIYRLDPQLTDWAYNLTKDVEIPDSEAIAHIRAEYTDHPMAQKPPFVLKGDNLAGMTFWHGEVLNDWANDWVSYWSKGKGNFVSSAMEDTGTYLSLSYLAAAGKVDLSRLMVLRTASNYTMPHPGLTAAENLAKESEGYAGLDAALEAAYRVGATVVDNVVTHWDQYESALPYEVTTK